MYSLKALPAPVYKAPDEDSLNWRPSREQQKQLEQGAYRCDCCGLVSRPHKQFPSAYMELCVLEGETRVLCAMCAQSQFLGRSVNGRRQHGFIFYGPNLSQGQVTRLAQWVYLAKRRGNALAETADHLVATLRRELVAPAAHCVPDFNEGDVQVFAENYSHWSPKVKANGDALWGALKYWPDEAAFEPQMRFWSVAAFKDVKDIDINHAINHQVANITKEP